MSLVSELITNDGLAGLLGIIVRRRAAGTLDIPTIDIAPLGGRPQPRYRLADVEAFLSRKSQP